VPRDDPRVPGWLVEQLVVPEAQAVEPEQLGGRDRGRGMEDEVVEGGLEQPAAQAVEGVARRVAVVVLLHLVEKLDPRARPRAQALDGLADRVESRPLENTDARHVAVLAERSHLRFVEAVTLGFPARAGAREEARERSDLRQRRCRHGPRIAQASVLEA
jgi:hypothetical protein